MPEVNTVERRLQAGKHEVSALLTLPADARGLYVFAHGAGAGMRHPFMESASAALARHGVGSYRFQFPYMENGRKAPDRAPVLQDTIRAVVADAAEAAPDLPLIAGGKSMGGRMTSLLAAEGGLTQVQALVFFGFPLHAAGKPSADRGAHLKQVNRPLLFLQGTRDKLADLTLLRPLCDELGPRARLHVIDGGDHSFAVPKKTGRTAEEVMEELTTAVERFCRDVVG